MKTSEDARSEAPSGGQMSEFRGLVVLAEEKWPGAKRHPLDTQRMSVKTDFKVCIQSVFDIWL